MCECVGDRGLVIEGDDGSRCFEGVRLVLLSVIFQVLSDDLMVEAKVVQRKR